MPFDLIAVSRGGELRRIQVKYRPISKEGSISVILRNIHSDKNGIHRKPVDLNSFDCYALYCPQTDKVYYVLNDEIAPNVQRAFTLRIQPPRNNQSKKVNLASEYEGADRIFEQCPRSSNG
jgi:PD-(D/E)XK endonuclease